MDRLEGHAAPVHAVVWQHPVGTWRHRSPTRSGSHRNLNRIRRFAASVGSYQRGRNENSTVQNYTARPVIVGHDLTERIERRRLEVRGNRA